MLHPLHPCQHSSLNFPPLERSSVEVYRNHSVCLSVRLSVLCPSVHLSVCPLFLCLSVVQIPVWPITFLCLDIGLPYLVYGCISMTRCVAYNHNPDTMLTFDLKVKFIGFLTCLFVRLEFFFALTLAYHIWKLGVSP